MPLESGGAITPFVAALVVGVAGYAWLFVRSPERARRAGTFADDA